MDENRRGEIRVKVNFPLSIKSVYIKNGNVIHFNKVLPAEVVDLSASGVLLRSPLNIPENIQFHLELPLDGSAILCTAEIVRKFIKDDGYYYGCRLISIRESEVTRIRRYVLRKQALEARRNPYEKNMHQSGGFKVSLKKLLQDME